MIHGVFNEEEVERIVGGLPVFEYGFGSLSHGIDDFYTLNVEEGDGCVTIVLTHSYEPSSGSMTVYRLIVDRREETLDGDIRFGIYTALMNASKDMRVEILRKVSRGKAKKLCPWTKVTAKYGTLTICFESREDYTRYRQDKNKFVLE